MHVPEERKLIDSKIALIANENPLRSNPKFKLYMNDSGNYDWEYHSPDHQADGIEMAHKFDKRATFNRKLNKE